MRKPLFSFLCMLSITLAPFVLAVEQKDDPKCKDHPLVTRMSGSWIHGCDHKTFDSRPFTVGKGKKEVVEGELWILTYYPQASLPTKPSEVQILRNYENALKGIGATVVYSEKPRETLKLLRDGKEIWIEVWAEFTGKYGFTIVERKAMEQEIVANADVFSKDIRSTGHAAVYGIYFDTGRSVIKPESEQAISEIAKLLKADAGLKVYVVGHTDNVGGLESNMKLSRDRADAVVRALVGSQGIAAARLKADGVGPLAPVASNDSDDGKAKNRRVELVKQ